jgi:two-component SAPR family response regulator
MLWQATVFASSLICQPRIARSPIRSQSKMDDPVKVLVIEDDEILREVLSDVLAARGLHVVASARGDKAVELARHERFDLIVADIRMEGMNGLDAIEQAREFQPDVGSIVVSGFASEEETLRAVRLNVAGYLKKPFEVPDLMDLINNYLTQRAERLRREREQRGLREALLWSLEQQGVWAEEARPGSVLRASQLASQLALEMGLPAEMGRQTMLGTVLRQLESLGAQAPYQEAMWGLESYATLLSAWRQRDPESPADFAVSVSQGLAPDDDWPPAEGLENGHPRLIAAYQKVLAKRGQVDDPSEPEPAGHAPAGLLALARTLEHGGDLDGARSAFEKVISEAGVSQVALAGLLGLARVAVAQGATSLLEKSMSELLSLAEKLGPVTFGIAELEGAKILNRAGHPATVKLLARASLSLSRVNLTIPWATAVVSQAALTGAEAPQRASLGRALELLSQPHHHQESIEHLDALVPALLTLGQMPGVTELVTRFVREYPHEIASQLRQGRLGLVARGCLVDLLQAQGASVPEALLELLRQDPDPEIRARGVALQAALGRCESVAILRVHSLGQLEVSLGDQPLDDRVWKTQKIKLLFARLADAWPRPISVDRIMAELWPESDQTLGRNNLNAAVSNLRKPLRSGPQGFDPVVRTADALGLNPDQPFWHDVKELELASQQGRRYQEAGNVEAAMSYFSRVVRLYRGPYLEGSYYDWVSQRQLTLENMVVEALQLLAEHRADQHRYREALEYALRLILIQPEHEKAHHVVMTSYLGLDQHDKAIAHFELHKTRLDGELDDEALVGLTRLYHMARYGFVQEPGFKAGI